MRVEGFKKCLPGRRGLRRESSSVHFERRFSGRSKLDTSNPATFSMSILLGSSPARHNSGKTFLIRCRKLRARGSSCPFASGFNTVYGWHEGDKSHVVALRGIISEAVSVEMSF